MKCQPILAGCHSRLTLQRDRSQRVALIICQMLPSSDIFNHIGEAFHKKGILFSCFLFIKKTHTTPFSLKCYTQRKKIQVRIHRRVLQEGKREGGSRVERRELTAAARPEHKVTRIQPRGNTTVAMRYVSVIIYI